MYCSVQLYTLNRNPSYDPNNFNVINRNGSTPADSEETEFADEDRPAWCTNYRGDYENVNISALCTHDLICWSYQVARGMEYLSGKKVRSGK